MHILTRRVWAKGFTFTVIQSSYSLEPQDFEVERAQASSVVKTGTTSCRISFFRDSQTTAPSMVFLTLLWSKAPRFISWNLLTPTLIFCCCSNLHFGLQSSGRKTFRFVAEEVTLKTPVCSWLVSVCPLREVCAVCRAEWLSCV